MQNTVSEMAMQTAQAVSLQSITAQRTAQQSSTGDAFLMLMNTLLGQMQGAQTEEGTAQPGTQTQTTDSLTLLLNMMQQTGEAALPEQTLPGTQQKTDETASTMAQTLAMSMLMRPGMLMADEAELLKAIGETQVTGVQSTAAQNAQTVLMQQAVPAPTGAQAENAQSFAGILAANEANAQSAQTPITQVRYTETPPQQAVPEQLTAVAQTQGADEQQASQTGARKQDENNPAAQSAVQSTASTHKTDASWLHVRKAEAIAQEPKLLEQLSGGINENLAAGKKEFVMKLKPEALGEITVKLLETEGKMTLRIETANSQTAKLINSELAALRESMRPMQVEVHEAVQQTSEAQSSAMQFNMSGQQFAGGQRAFYAQQQHHGAAQNSFEPEMEQQEAAQQAAISGSDGLDTYI